jgi:hypothetical protein
MTQILRFLKADSSIFMWTLLSRLPPSPDGRSRKLQHTKVEFSRKLPEQLHFELGIVREAEGPA